jgi:hypothetical protein
LRHKWEKITDAANEDTWTLHVAERSMLAVVDPDVGPLQAAWPEVAPVAAQVEPPAACMDQRVADKVSEPGTNSQGAAFETMLSEQPWTSTGSGEPICDRLCAKQWPNRVWPFENCLRTVAKAPAGRTSLPF